MPVMRPIKVEPGVGGAQEEEEVAADEEQAQQQQHPSRRRRVDEGGLAALQTRSHIEAQAAAFQGMEQTRVMGLELQQAKVQNAELKAEIRNRDAALEAKDAIIQGKDATLLAKDAVIEGKNALLQAKDAEISRLQAVLARRGAEPAAPPAPSRAAAAAEARASAGSAAPDPVAGAVSSQQLQVTIPQHCVWRRFPLTLFPLIPFRRKRVVQRRSVCGLLEILRLQRSS